MISPHAGIGLKSCHYEAILDTRPPLAFLEIHAENYMGPGGPPHRWLNALCQHYPLSVHGVGLSLGSDQPLDPDHLDALKAVIERTQPALVSEHLAWSRWDQIYLNDLLAIPYTPQSLNLFCDHVDQTQEHLGRQILIENPSAYFAFASTTMTEPEFLGQLMRRTGCGLLLDVNNVYVSCCNLGLDPLDYLNALPRTGIGEYHLAGHHLRQQDGREIRIDNHGSKVCAAVWDLYAQAVARFGRHPTLIEWDCDIPDLTILLEQAQMADEIAERIRHDGFV